MYVGDCVVGMACGVRYVCSEDIVVGGVYISCGLWCIVMSAVKVMLCVMWCAGCVVCGVWCLMCGVWCAV